METKIEKLKEAQLPEAVAAINEINRTDEVKSRYSISDFEILLASDGKFIDRFLVCRLGGKAVAYSWCRLLEGRGQRWFSWQAVVPKNLRGQGIGSLFLERVLAKAKEERVDFVTTKALIGQHDATYFLKKRGFVAATNFWTLEHGAPIKSFPELPEGFATRGYIAGTDAPLLADIYNRSFKGQFGFQRISSASVRILHHHPHFDPEGVIFIIRGEAIVGFARAGCDPEEKVGWAATMGVDSAYRGRGLGRWLLSWIMNYLHDRGIERLEVTVEGESEEALKLFLSEKFKVVEHNIAFKLELEPDKA
jgi:mycothiol synthase